MKEFGKFSNAIRLKRSFSAASKPLQSTIANDSTLPIWTRLRSLIRGSLHAVQTPRINPIAVCCYASIIQLIYSPIAFTANTEEALNETPIAAETYFTNEANTDTYTINFNNISIIELIRFASKITNLNFVFEETDLQFSVTVISEEPVTSSSMMAVLSQVLRMHDLIVLEQAGNVLITKSTQVNQIPPIISSDLPDSKAGNAALVTRIFRIKNANVNSIANIIRPMTSAGALIEVSVETRQLIVTDITTNVEQIATLLASLDAPHTPLDVETYIVKNIGPQELITLTEQILTPFAEGNPLIFVPQTETNSIFIVSTPHLIERAMTIMEDLDIPTKPVVIGKPSLTGKSVFIYNAIHRTPDELINELRQIAARLKNDGGAPSSLEIAIDGVQEIQESGSLMFVIDVDTLPKLKEILASLDTLSNAKAAAEARGKSTFLVYNPHYLSGDELSLELIDLGQNLKDSGLSDPLFLSTIQSMKWVPSSNALVFTGDPQSIERLNATLKTMDSPKQTSSLAEKGFFIYKLQYSHCDTVLEELKSIATKMPPSTLQNINLVAAINKIECIKTNNSLLITGTGDAIEQIKILISDFDTPAGASQAGQSFLIYKPKFLPATDIQAALTDLSNDLQESGLSDPQLFQTLSTMRYISQTNSLLFTGSQNGLDKVQNLINGIDTSAALGAIQSIGNVTFLIYKVQSASPDKLISSLKTFALDLKQSNVADKQLADAIDGVKWIKETNSLLFTGNNQALERVEQLVKKFDIPTLGGPSPVERNAGMFIIYNPKYLSGDELISILCDFMHNLMSSGVSDTGLFDTINNLRWIDKTSSLLISGDQLSVDKVQQLLVKFDIPSKENAAPSIESIDNTSFLVYKLQYHPGNDIQTALKEVAASLGKGASAPTALVDAVNSLQWVEVTNSLLCSGQQDVLVKLKELIQNLDVPLRQVFIEVLVIETSLSNQQNFGLMWGGQVQYFNKTIMQTGNFPVPSSQGSSTPTPSTTFPTNLQTVNATTTPNNTLIPFSSGFDLGVIGDIIMHKGRSFISLGSLLNALQLDTDSTIILNPKIITQDNRQSTVFVGQNIPYTGSLVTNQSQNTVQNANIEYRDVGVSLTITPILGDGDVITMDIVQDISEVVQGTNVQISNTNLTGIQTNHTHMETRVHVPNNHFVALSGMINDTKTHFRTAIPCLGGLPVVGALFSENDRNAQKNNIIIFVRPQIVQSYQEYKAITEHQEWLYKDNARLPVLKEEFDEGIDMVKLPENE